MHQGKAMRELQWVTVNAIASKAHTLLAANPDESAACEALGLIEYAIKVLESGIGLQN